MTTVRETWINGRWPLLLPEHRADRPEWPWWEAARLASMWHELMQPRIRTPLVYDVGAEEGDLPALWALWGCDVFCIEPNERVWPNIKCVFEANDLTRKLRGAFVGFAADRDEPGVDGAVYVTRGAWPACADGDVIGDHGFLNLAERPDVQRATIDHLARLYGAPDAITIDVEGAELHVLRGADRVLKINRPLVWVSVHPEFMRDLYGIDDGLAEVRSFMHRHAYDERFLAIDHEHHWLFTPRS